MKRVQGLAGSSLAQHPQGLTDLHLRHMCRGSNATHQFIFSSLSCSASPVSFLIIPSSENEPLPRALTHTHTPSPKPPSSRMGQHLQQDGKQHKQQQLKADRVHDQPQVRLGEPWRDLELSVPFIMAPFAPPLIVQHRPFVSLPHPDARTGLAARRSPELAPASPHLGLGSCPAATG